MQYLVGIFFRYLQIQHPLLTYLQIPTARFTDATWAPRLAAPPAPPRPGPAPALPSPALPAATWIWQGVVEMVPQGCPLPLFIEPLGAVVKATAPWWRLIPDARISNEYQDP